MLKLVEELPSLMPSSNSMLIMLKKKPLLDFLELKIEDSRMILAVQRKELTALHSLSTLAMTINYNKMFTTINTSGSKDNLETNGLSTKTFSQDATISREEEVQPTQLTSETCLLPSWPTHQQAKSDSSEENDSNQ